MKNTIKLLTTLLRLIPVALWHVLGMIVFRPLNPVALKGEKLARVIGLSAVDIEAYEWQAVDHGTTSRWRLQLPGECASLFVKTNPPDFTTRFFGAMFQLSLSELGFYRDLQCHVNIVTPKSHGQFGNRYRYCIFIEDLGDRARFTTIKDRCDLSMAQSVIDTMASLHASLWEDQRFDSQWRWVNGQEYRRNHVFLDLLRQQSSLSAIERYKDLLPKEMPGLVTKINRAYPQLEKHWASGDRTLAHGDAHIGNMFFLPDGICGFLDWQVLGFEQGMRDVTYFMINSLPTDIRQRHQYDLIARYVQSLNEEGIIFTIEQARQQYLQHASYAWIASAVTAASDTMQEEKIAAAGLVRASRAMVDLEIAKIL
jgi:thiamine kinase-like enzyme